MAAALTLGGRRVAILDRARIYACGITPYDVTHLGHAATFVWVDTLARTLRLLRVEPEICRNITDVDDVLGRGGTPCRGTVRLVRGRPAVLLRPGYGRAERAGRPA